MPRWNGGVIGAANNPTSSSAKGIWSLSEATKAIRAGLWPPSNAGADPYFENVTLLLPGDGTNGAQNNTFLDSSTNNFTITRNGNTTQGTFSPFSKVDGRWSNYFAASYASIAYNSSICDFGTGAFTIELWTYCPAAANNVLLSTYNYTGNVEYGWFLGTNASGYPYFTAFAAGGNAAQTVTSSATMAANTWNHIAISRDGSSNAKLFLNGQLVASSSSFTQNIAYNNSFLFGTTLLNGGPQSSFTGYMSNVRVVKGSAVYTAAFTPSTGPLTAISNTTLLTCQSNRFKDNSTNNFTFIPITVSVQPFSPFPSLTAYAAGTNGGSGYFDGSGDHLITPSNAALGLGTGDFTVECWYYHLSRASTDGLFAPGTSNLNIYINTSGTLGYFNGTSGQNSSQTVPLNTWGHIALVRVSGTIKMYYNGVEVLSQSNTTNFSTTNWYIGTNSALDNDPAHGYMTDARIVKGTAVYTSAFTPPTTPLTAISGTSLLLNFTNGGIIDTSMSNDLETVGGAQISTTQSKFGGASMSFDGTGDWLAIPAGDKFAFGSGDYTVEAWIYFNSITNTDLQIIFMSGSTGGNTFYFHADGNQLSVGTASVLVSNQSTTFNTGTWYHVAACRSGTTLRLFVNGTQIGSNATDSTSWISSGTARVGSNESGGQTVNGYIDDLRVTKGYARYTTNFTAPSGPFNGFGD